MNKKNNNKGFTLAELLIVVAIIAVLVAIAIPVFTAQLEKSREATDAANVRSAYAEVVVKVLENPQGSISQKSVTFKQRQAGWQNSSVGANLTALAVSNSARTGDLDVVVSGTPGGTSSGKAAFTYSEGTSSKNPKLTIKIS